MRDARPISAAVVARTRRRLLAWGREHFVSYPWRTETDPWLTLLAELLLQRTRASQVVEVFVVLRKRFPTAGLLAEAGLPTLQPLLSHLGLHKRVPLIIDIAREVAARGGTPPDSIVALRKHRGIGSYSAAAWLSLHRSRRAVIIDANVARWLSRFTGKRCGRDPRHVAWVEETAEYLTPARAFRDYNYAVLDFTIAVCAPRTPFCASCPMRSDCRFFSEIHRNPARLARPGTRDRGHGSHRR